MAKPNPFRPVYRELKVNEQQIVDNIKTKAFELLQMYPVGVRETAIAITKLEESVMWAVKGVTT